MERNNTQDNVTNIKVSKTDIETGKKSKHCRYFKAKVLQTHKKQEATQELKNTIEESTIVFSDQSTSYVDIAD